MSSDSNPEALQEMMKNNEDDQSSDSNPGALEELMKSEDKQSPPSLNTGSFLAGLRQPKAVIQSTTGGGLANVLAR